MEPIKNIFRSGSNANISIEQYKNQENWENVLPEIALHPR